MHVHRHTDNNNKVISLHAKLKAIPACPTLNGQALNEALETTRDFFWGCGGHRHSEQRSLVRDIQISAEAPDGGLRIWLQRQESMGPTCYQSRLLVVKWDGVCLLATFEPLILISHGLDPVYKLLWLPSSLRCEFSRKPLRCNRTGEVLFLRNPWHKDLYHLHRISSVHLFFQAQYTNSPTSNSIWSNLRDSWRIKVTNNFWHKWVDTSLQPRSRMKGEGKIV